MRRLGKNSYIIGAGGFATEVAGVLYRNNFNMLGNVVTHKKYLSDNIIMINKIERNSNVLIGIGEPKIKENIYDKHIKGNLKGINLIDSSVIFIGEYPNFKNNEGLILLPNSTITSNVTFGKYVSVDRMVSIGHDCTIDDFTQISPMSMISGNVNIGKRCFIGTGAMIKQGVNICDDVIIGMGSVVLNDINQAGTYVGNKLRKIK